MNTYTLEEDQSGSFGCHASRPHTPLAPIVQFIFQESKELKQQCFFGANWTLVWRPVFMVVIRCGGECCLERPWVDSTSGDGAQRDGAGTSL